MKKKTLAFTIVSLFIFIAISTGIFFGVYNLTGHLIRNYPEFFGEEESYSGLSKEYLENAPDEDLEYEIVNDIWISQIGEDAENEYALAKQLPPSSKYLYATWMFENEFYNGGFVQFFYNYSGQFAQEAKEGYEFFDLPEHAALMAKAIELYKEEEELYKKAFDDESTVAFTNLYKESKLAELDEEFDAIGDKAYESKIEYIRAHMDEFVSE